MIAKKREKEREEFFRRLEESRKKFAEAQDNLKQFEKKVSFNNEVYEKVIFCIFETHRCQILQICAVGFSQ